METEKSIEIVWRRISIIQRFSSVLYPFDIIELLRQLPALGYITPSLTLTVSPDPNQPIAQKGDVELVINQDNKTIGLVGRSIEKTVITFRELYKFYSNTLDPSSGLKEQYIELNGDGWLKTNHNPLSTFTSFWSDFKPLEGFNSVFDTDVINFGIDLVPPNVDPNSVEWFHVTIQPHIPSATKRYNFRFVLRGVDTEAYLDKFSNVENSLVNIVKKIES